MGEVERKWGRGERDGKQMMKWKKSGEGMRQSEVKRQEKREE